MQKKKKFSAYEGYYSTAAVSVIIIKITFFFFFFFRFFFSTPAGQAGYSFRQGKLAIFYVNPKQISTQMFFFFFCFFLHFCCGQTFKYNISKVGQNRKICNLIFFALFLQTPTSL